MKDTSRVYKIKVHCDLKISEVKELVRKVSNIPDAYQRIIFQVSPIFEFILLSHSLSLKTNELADDVTLHSYGISEQCTLLMIVSETSVISNPPVKNLTRVFFKKKAQQTL